MAYIYREESFEIVGVQKKYIDTRSLVQAVNSKRNFTLPPQINQCHQNTRGKFD